MTVIRNIDGTSLKVNYNDEGKVTSYTKFASDGETILDKLVIDSSEAYQRIFTDKSNKITRQQYDAQLNQVSEITDADGYFREYDENNELQSISVTEDHTNLLTNGDFSDNRTGWTYPRNRGVEVVTDNDNGFKLSKYDNNVIKLPGEYNYINYAKQTYLFNDNEDHTDEVYTAGVWAKVNGSIPRTDELNDGKTRTVGVLLNGYTNGESGETTELLADITFDNSITDWQYMMVTFKLDKNYDGIEFALSYNYQVGDAYFDGATLYKSSISETIKPTPIPTCPCTNCSEPDCPCTCESEETCTHIWCKRGTTTTENEYGLITKETTTDGVSSMEKSYAYVDSKNYLLNSVDENGTITHYSYDSNSGKLTSMAVGNENDEINYTYNAVGLLKTVSQTVTNIVTGEQVNMLSEYTYDGDNLTQISHNGSIYSFGYDKFGNVSNVNTGSQSLAQYSYNDSNQLGCLLYGNGDRINYTYDNNGNITSISTQHHGETTDSIIEYEYTYNDNGELVSYTDNVNDTVTTYTDTGYTITIPSADENTEDTVIYSTVTSDETNESTINLFGYKFSTEKSANTYDIETGQTISKLKYSLPLNSYNITAMGENLTVTDYFGRNISSSFNLKTDDITDFNKYLNKYDYSVSTNYTYKQIGNNRTSNLIESITSTIKVHHDLTDEEIEDRCTSGEIGSKEANELRNSHDKILKSLTTSYEYDNAGRITRIYNDGGIVSLYGYDEAGQLTEEINCRTGNATCYTYDKGGNIESKVYYNNFEYDEDNDKFIYGEPIKTINYSYNNQNQYFGNEWGDLLTNYNGLDIEYDEIGNPLNYRGENYHGQEQNYNFVWNGRQLTEVYIYDSQNGSPLEHYIYTYDANGLRTKKERYLWSSSDKTYNLYQTNEYVWEDNIVKGYKITYADANNITNPDAPHINVLPIYDSNQDMIGVKYKIHDLNTGNSSSENKDYESVLYFTKDAQGNILSASDLLSDYDDIVYQFDAFGKGRILIPSEEERINAMPDKTLWQQIEKGLSYEKINYFYSIVIVIL